MAYTTIDNPSEFFNTLIWTGNGSNPRSHTGLGFKPDWTWHKIRDTASSHMLYDSTRGVGKRLHSNQNVAEATETAEGTITSFDSDGFTLAAGTSNDFYVNTSSKTYVAWNWKANGGTTTSFTESGSNPGGTYQANTTAGFSIVTYTGTGSAGTVQHGLGAVPELIIFKDRGDSSNWLVYTEPTGNTHTLFLNRTVAKEDDATLYNDTTPTSSVFSLGAHNDINANDDTYVAYCFTSIKGYSKIGSYTGNGSNDGTFVYTGFKPAWLLIKRTDAAEDWWLHDNKRNPINPIDKQLYANNTNSVATETSEDFVSNGFKFRNFNLNWNASGGTFIYMAFAEHPFVSSKGVPVTAR